MKIFMPVLFVFLLVACTPVQPSAVRPLTVQPVQPSGAAAITGTVPIMVPDPAGVTEQFTDAERALLRAELQSAAQRGSSVAGRVNEGRFRSDVAVLRKEAEAERKRRLDAIESRTANESAVDISQ